MQETQRSCKFNWLFALGFDYKNNILLKKMKVKGKIEKRKKLPVLAAYQLMGL